MLCLNMWGWIGKGKPAAFPAWAMMWWVVRGKRGGALRAERVRCVRIAPL